jgi:hypothetical protein
MLQSSELHLRLALAGGARLPAGRCSSIRVYNGFPRLGLPPRRAGSSEFNNCRDPSPARRDQGDILGEFINQLAKANAMTQIRTLPVFAATCVGQGGTEGAKLDHLQIASEAACMERQVAKHILPER